MSRISKQLFSKGLHYPHNLRWGLTFLFLLTLPLLMSGQSVWEVSGTVVDASTNEGLPGVTIQVKGTMSGAVTDLDGNYTINVPGADAILIFSYVGFVTEEIQVDGQTNINVTLIQDLQSLDEVVVVGYGTSKKSDLTGALSNVSSKDFENEPITNISQVLKGRASGVTISETSGAPGSDSKIRIRGINSINRNNSPLYIINGISGDIASINVNDIESIEVLKDASSTAIYGNRGSNGVILITTKTGKKGQTKVDFESFVGLDHVPDNRLIKTMNGADYMQVVNVHKGSETFSQAEIDSVRQGNLGTNWQKEQLKMGLTQNYQLAISGGADRTRFYLSGGFVNQEGIVINSSYKKYNLQANINQEINDRIKVNFISSINQRDKHNVDLADRLFESQVWSPHLPSDAKEDLLGSSIGAKHPVYSIEELDNDNRMIFFNVSFDAEIKLAEGLTFTPRFGINKDLENNKYFEGQYVKGMKSSLRIEDKERTHIENSNILTYIKEIGTHSRITLTGVNEWIKRDEYGYTLKEEEIEDDSFGYYQLGLGAAQKLPTNYVSEFILLSYLFRANYSLFDKYLFTGSIRADASSRFRDDNKWGYFPSGALAWRISDESFIQDIPQISNLKLRTSYGMVGNADVNAYSTMGTVTQQSNVTSYAYFGESVLYNGFSLGSPPNALLTWESQQQFNIGLDLALWERKLQLAFDFFNKNSNNLLLQQPLPLYISQKYPDNSVFGYGISNNYTTNAGKVNNTGYELSIDYTPVFNANFSYSINLNGSRFTNEVIDLAGDEEIPMKSLWTIPTHRVAVGKPIGSFYLYDYDGVWKQEEEELAESFNAKPGQPKYVDHSEDNKITEDDIVYVGNANPDFTWGFNQTFTYRNITLNMLLVGSHGGEIYNLNYAFTMSQNLFSATATHEDALNYYDPATNPDSDVPSIIQGERFNSTRFLQDASYIKLKNISLSYFVPRNVLNHFELTVYGSARNLLTLTGYKGYDPELSATGDDNLAGFDMSSYPIPRSFTFGVKIGF